MAKHLKLNIKNTQIAKAINLGALKSKLEDKKATAVEEKKTKAVPSRPVKAPKAEASKVESPDGVVKEEAPKIRARSRSAFAEPVHDEAKASPATEDAPLTEETKQLGKEETPRRRTSEELRREIFQEEAEKQETPPPPAETVAPSIEEASRPATALTREPAPPAEKLGPTGKHVKDLLPQRPQAVPQAAHPPKGAQESAESAESETAKAKAKSKGKGREGEAGLADEEAKKSKAAKFKEFRDIKPAKRQEQVRFDARDRQGLRDGEEETHWRKRRPKQMRHIQEDVTIRPTSLAVRIPIAIKDLASEMKLKASQLIAKLFSQGIVATLNDMLEDETTIQLLGHEFGCEITIDTKEEQRIRITDKTIKEEVQATDPSLLITRPPVVAFMGHVDHGKTSLIDMIRKSNRAAGEAGAITQHIGAFRCSTPVGDLTILDTPGHEAFSAMRARGADVTDIVVLVVAGDEGLRQQSIEALQHAKAAKVTIVVAINKSDKPNFNVENVYRQLAEQELIPEVWGGQTITVNCSAVTGEGIPQLLEMLALQAEVLELKSGPTCRARGTVLESEMHKGMGSIATVLVQNGTLRCGDALVFGQLWGRVKTMQNEFRKDLEEAGPSTPVEITGISGLPEAGQEFIVVKNEKEARAIAEARMQGMRQVNLLQAKKLSMENLFQQASETNKKILNIVLRADVQGSLEALKAALLKIESSKADLNIIFTGVGEVSESDVQLAAASRAVIIGFHTQIESHAEVLQKQLGVEVRLHSIIYHAIDDVKDLMGGLLDKIAQETDRGKAEVKAIFKSSQYGTIAGCLVTEGTVNRNYSVRLRRDGEIIWKGTVASLKRVKEDVREVAKGLECGIVLNNSSDVKEGDIFEAYEITYISQEL